MSGLELLWSRARPFLEDALAHAQGTHRLEDVMKGVIEGRLQLWVGERSAGVSEILTFPRRRALNLFLAGGDLGEIKALQPGVEAYARGHGCTMMMFSGRLTPAARKASGWARALPGYQPNWISLSKELT